MIQNQIQTQIDLIKHQLITKYKPEKIILFGSAVYGKMTKDSDLDFLIIKDDKRTFHERVADLYGLIEKNIAADFIVLTPAEYKRTKDRNPLIREISSRGKVIYG